MDFWISSSLGLRRTEGTLSCTSTSKKGLCAPTLSVSRDEMRFFKAFNEFLLQFNNAWYLMGMIWGEKEQKRNKRNKRNPKKNPNNEKNDKNEKVRRHTKTKGKYMSIYHTIKAPTNKNNASASFAVFPPSSGSQVPGGIHCTKVLYCAIANRPILSVKEIMWKAVRFTHSKSY